MQLTDYIEGMFEKFGFKDCNPARTPMHRGYIRFKNSQPLEDATRYRSLVGVLLYISVSARPDIAASVSFFGRRVSQPSLSDWKAGKHVSRVPSSWSWCSVQEKLGYWRDTLTPIGPVPTIAENLRPVFDFALSDTCQEFICIRQLLNDLGEVPGRATHVFKNKQSCLSYFQAKH